MGLIAYSSLTNCLPFKRSPSRSGYSRAAGHERGGFIDAIGGRGTRGGSGGRGDVDAENRLIDQLDEEWED